MTNDYRLTTTSRPALAGFLSCAFGIAIARIVSASALWHLLIAISLFFLFAALSFFLRNKFGALSRTLAILAIASLGFLLLSSREFLFEHSVINKTAEIYSGETTIYG